MGADFVQLLDRRNAEFTIAADEQDLAAIVEARTRPVVGFPVWKTFYDAKRNRLAPFAAEATASERLAVLLSSGESLPQIKRQLIDDLFISDWLYLDYFGCMAEVFHGEPPGAMTWETFLKPMYQVRVRTSTGAGNRRAAQPDTDGESGCYLLTGLNVEAMVRSLRKNFKQLSIMKEPHVAKLERWHRFCESHTEYTVLYKIDV